jgi:hypothetical protein
MLSSLEALAIVHSKKSVDFRQFLGLSATDRREVKAEPEYFETKWSDVLRAPIIWFLLMIITAPIVWMVIRRKRQ